jgi:hypothetical protein
MDTTEKRREPKDYVPEALNRTAAELSLEGNIAQNLFLRWYEEACSEYNGADVPMPKAKAAIEKCFLFAGEFRKTLVQLEFERKERYDKEFRERYQTPQGKTIIHLPDAGIVQPHVPPGSIAGM